LTFIVAKNAEVERNLVDAKATMEKYGKDYEMLHIHFQQATDELAEQVSHNKQLRTGSSDSDDCYSLC
jgi:hypothetical protein